MREKNIYYRPEWTAGRFHKHKDESYALMYNLLEGKAFFFEDESALIIECILNKSRNQKITLNELTNSLKGEYEVSEIEVFCNDLLNAGLLIPINVELDEKKISDLRRQVGMKRKEQAVSVKKTINEKLPFVHSDAETSYLEILEKDGIPFSVMFELTYNCNECCIHCFNPGAARNASEESKRHNRKELTLSDYQRIIKELKDLGVVKIVLSGGDPFVKKDIWKIIDIIYSEGFALEVFTNGLGIVNKVETLAKFYPSSIGLSIYSNIEEVHDGITQTKGSLRITKIVANKVAELGIPLYLKCPIMNDNYESYGTVKTLAKKYGALAQFDINLSDSIDGDVSIGNFLQVKGAKLQKLLRDIDIPLYVGEEAPEMGKKQIDFNDQFCGAGFSIISISPEGDINPCNSFALKLGSVKESSIKEILKTSETLLFLKNKKIRDYEECATHDRCSFCNRCPGQSLIEHGNFLKPSSANCYLAKARLEVAENLRLGFEPIDEALEIHDNKPRQLRRILTKSFRNIEIEKQG